MINYSKLMSKKISILDILEKKNCKQSITMLTAYDSIGATLVDEAGIDIILVGDSVAMTMLGHESTNTVTMEEMLHHCRAASRGRTNSLLVGDMPFMSYQVSPTEALHNAGRFIKEAGVDAVKLEGGREVSETVNGIVNAGIPVMGHLGLTPQTVTRLGGYKVQAKTADSAKRLLEDALLLQKAGCFSIVLEMVPAFVAEEVSKKLKIPTIGIGAGVGCDGQVLVFHDILGLFDHFKPKFVKQYANLRPQIVDAIHSYRADVEARSFPAQEHGFDMEEPEKQAFLKNIQDIDEDTR
ncbi:MAG: 3-methyl-2-oxobutanoate hydroxymethyltransferase [SAR324 cluster bacterium]|nr:3-methyl-2-oxobutanoate hydroxymethyltransferase [SAR324 cluster bacterium]